MLMKHKSIKHIFITLFMLACLGTATTARAQGEIEAMTGMVNLMESFMELMDSVYEMNADNEKAILLQMHAIEEIYKEQGKHKDAVAVYRRILDNSNNSTVRNMAYHRMADVLKESSEKSTAFSGALIDWIPVFTGMTNPAGVYTRRVRERRTKFRHPGNHGVIIRDDHQGWWKC